jgi:hypothetical protein
MERTSKGCHSDIRWNRKRKAVPKRAIHLFFIRQHHKAPVSGTVRIFAGGKGQQAVAVLGREAGIDEAVLLHHLHEVVEIGFILI